MFYGDKATVNCETGYSTGGKPTEGLSFEISVTADGGFSGIESCVPVDCGASPNVSHASTSTNKATFGASASYNCEAGYSTDKTAAPAAATFTVTCEADADFSEVPDLGKCVNVDDCADHTCGPRGTCIDKLEDYTCACDAGFEMTTDMTTEEKTCGNINDCGPDACGVGECIDEVLGYKCKCPSGYEVAMEGTKQETCEAKLCGVPPEVKNAATTPVGDGAAKHFFAGNDINYVCDAGYTLNGKAATKNTFDIKCKANGKFSGASKCQPVKCDKPPTVKNSKRTGSKTTYDKSIKFTCNKGYSIDGTTDGDSSFRVTCQESETSAKPPSASL